jgi:hypothetical protein
MARLAERCSDANRKAGGSRYDATSLARSIVAKSPRDATIKRLAAALGYDTITQHALVRELSAEDEWRALLRFDGLLRARSHSAIYPHLADVGPILRKKLNAAMPAKRRIALADMIVADEGLDERDPIGLVAEHFGIEIPKADAKTRRQNRREVYAALLWFVKAAGLGSDHRAKLDIHAALSAYISDYPILQDLLRDNVLGPSAEYEIWRIAPALAAARDAFIDALYGSRKFTPGPKFKLEYLKKEPKA